MSACSPQTAESASLRIACRSLAPLPCPTPAHLLRVPRRLAGRPFDFSARANLSKVFGRHPVLWLLPTNQGIEGNGIFFELSGAEGATDALASKW